jgi:hypothetical protein
VRTVSRPEADKDSAAKDAEFEAEGIDEFIEIIPTGPRALRSVYSYSLREFCYRCVADPTADELTTWQSLVRAMQAGAGVFAVANKSPDDEVEIRIGTEVIRRPGTGAMLGADAENWLQTLWLCMIGREQQRIDMLAATPVELLRVFGEEFDDFLYSWVRVWQTFWRNEEGLGDLLAESMRGTDPDSLRHYTSETVLRLEFPPMEMLYHLTMGDAEKFNDSLYKALELHRTFWTAEPERATNPNGFVALAPLAIACLARDTGTPIEVESEYMPKHLLEGTWLGEIPT